MSGEALLDSNVLVYAHDIGAAEKRPVARALISELIDADCGMNPGQVVLGVTVVKPFAHEGKTPEA